MLENGSVLFRFFGKCFIMGMYTNVPVLMFSNSTALRGLSYYEDARKKLGYDDFYSDMQ